jgi:hypothetical protein
MARYEAMAEQALTEASRAAAGLPPGSAAQAHIDIARVYAVLAAIDKRLPPGTLLTPKSPL